MPVVLRLRQVTTIPLEVDAVRVEVVRGQSPAQIAATPVQYGNQPVPLAEFFDVSGSAADDQEIVWDGDCSHVKRIATGLTAGRVRVEGSAGMHLGAEMRGGTVTVSGNAGDWAGAEMHGGRIHVHGNTGHFAGAVYRGGRVGMTGGELFIDGNSGDELGHTMRRGLIAVRGTTGNAAGFNMRAGTLLLFGAVGVRPGAGMKRGTIALLGDAPPPALLPTFRPACTWRPDFLRMYLNHLRQGGFAVQDAELAAACQRFSGDVLELGKGEILIREAGAA